MNESQAGPSPTGPEPVADRVLEQEDMMEFDVLVDVRLRGGIADPAGATIERALPALRPLPMVAQMVVLRLVVGGG